MLHLTVRAERPRISAETETELHVLVRTEFPVPPGAAQRPPLHLALILDRSSSMSGEKLELTRRAAILFMNWLTRRDFLTVVAYSENVDLIVPHAPLTDKRASAAHIESIQAEGNTNLSGGWLRGLAELETHRQTGHLFRAVLMTDGLANAGLTDPAKLQEIAAAFRGKEIATTTVGFGLDFDEKLLQAVAAAGGGRFHYVKEAEGLAQAFQEEFGELATMVAQNLELSVAFAPGVSCSEVLTDVPVEQRGGALTVRLGDARAGDVRQFLFRVKAPAAAGPEVLELARVRARCDALSGRFGTEEQSAPVRVELAAPGAPAAEADVDVRREVWLAESARLKLSVAGQLEEGELDAACAALRAHIEAARGLGAGAAEELVRDEMERLQGWAERAEGEATHRELRKELVHSAARQAAARGDYRRAAGVRKIRAELTPQRREEVHDVVASVEREMQARGYETERVERCKTVLRELLDNALEHGCLGRPAGLARAECHITDHYARVVVSDDGPGFDYPDKLAEEQAKALEPSQRGRGLLLIARLSDRVDFQTQQGTRAEAVVEREGLQIRTQALRAAAPEAADLNVATEVKGERGAVVVRLAGKLDAVTFVQVEETLNDLFRKGCFKLIVDLSSVQYISSAGAGVFIGARTQAEQHGGNVVLVSPTANVREVFELLGLTQLFPICQGLPEAMEFF
jgi:Ca-activated chloride channel family protein